MSIKRISIALLLATFAAGCGPEVSEICHDLEENCATDEDDCNEDGELLEEVAENAGCEEQWDVYLDCIDEASCGWQSACDDEGAVLEACTGEFPQ